METIDYKGYTIKLQLDESPSNPISEWDGNAKYALFHKGYAFQNDTDLDHKDYENWDSFKKALIRKYRPLAILPVYMYDHSGITIRTEPFSCKWDSGQLGFVFVNKDTLKEWGYKSRASYEKAAKQTLEDDLRANVSLYNHYLTGNVWGFEVVNSANEDIDSCWGFYGDLGKEEAVSQAKTIIDAEVNNNKKDEVERILIGMWTKIGMDIPENWEDIVQDCFEDIIETADDINWSNGDVSIAFRRWIEKQTK